MTTIEGVLRLLRGQRFDLSSEKATQAGIDQVFRDAGLDFKRELNLSAGDRPDFMIEPISAVVEVKMNRVGKRAIFKQLERYAEHDRVKVLILVTNTAMGLPPEIGGKPAYYVSLGTAWL